MVASRGCFWLVRPEPPERGAAGWRAVGVLCCHAITCHARHSRANPVVGARADGHARGVQTRGFFAAVRAQQEKEKRARWRASRMPSRLLKTL